MKLLRYGTKGHEKPGILDKNGKMRSLAVVLHDIDGSTSTIAAVHSVPAESLPLVGADVRLGQPIAKIGKFICIGLNYSHHAAEAGMSVPAEPVLFMKATSAITGPNDDVYLPPASKTSDWEVELGIVIGKEARYLEKVNALDYVAGACVVNGLSEREYQLERLGQWDKGKGKREKVAIHSDRSGPI